MRKRTEGDQIKAKMRRKIRTLRDRMLNANLLWPDSHFWNSECRRWGFQIDILTEVLKELEKAKHDQPH